MAQGFERRDVVEDANSKSRSQEAQSVPLSPVMRPQPSSFAKVGEAERQIADILGKVDVGLSKYIDKKKDQWGIEGAMARAEGKTEQEIASTGNRYTQQGWQAMNGKIAGDELYQSELNNIQTAGKTMDSKQYQTYLSGKFKELMDQAGGSDDARLMIGSYAADMYPKLVSEQIKQSNAYNMGQTKDTGRKMIVSTAHTDGVEATNDLLDPKLYKLSPEDYGSMVKDAIKDDYALGSDKVDQAVRARNPVATTGKAFGAPNMSNILNLVGQAESTNNYTAVYGGSNPRLTSMTVDQVLALPAQPTAKAGVKSSAVGKYQIIKGTLEGLKKELGLKGDETFDEDLQDQLGVALLKRRGVDDFLSGKMTAEAFQANLAQEWAGIPKDKSGLSAYDSDGVNKATVEPGAVLQALGGDQSGSQLYDSLSAIGMRSDDINDVLKARESFQRENSSKFDANRVLAEQDIKQAAIDMNDKDLFQKIQDTKEANNYSDAWAEQTWNQSLAQRKEDMKERKKTIKVQTMIATTSVKNGSTEEQQSAIDFVTQQAVAANPDAMDPTSPNNAQARHAAMDQVFKFMYTNQITDKRMSNAWEVASVGDIIDKEGKVKPSALDAYTSYLQAKNSVNDPMWAQTLLSDKTKDLFLMADSYRSSDSEADASQALGAASAFIQKQQALKGVNNLPWWKDMAATQVVTDKLVDNTLPGILKGYGIGRGQAQMRWSINGDAVEKAATSRDVTDRIKMEAAKMWGTYKNWDDQNAARELALAKATNKVMTQSEFIAGTFVYTGDQPPLSQRIGMGGIKNASNMVVSRIMGELGSTIWKDYNSTDIYTHSQQWYVREAGLGKVWEATKDIAGDTFGSPLKTLDHVGDKITEKRLGVPEFSVIMNPSGNALVLAPYTNYDRTQQGAPYILSVEKMREAASFLNKGDEAGFKKWIEDEKKSAPKY
jgi:muramidase (phage lysozyme)